eukprot:TRINITY_DN840_c1_g2_i1.p1 TRINITY_DN840_c1_g2~~TRINITY_DN840_c1_g2_i1.p1  ORF type:complete len:447 (-),score=83.14 TRINITY_DN840_c1_g2_i1:11-1159(-)
MKKLDTCEKLIPPKGKFFNSSAVFAWAFGGCNFEKHAMLAEEAGASALIMTSVDPGGMALMIDGNLKDAKIPILLVDVYTSFLIADIIVSNYQLNQNTVIDIEADYNVWYEDTQTKGWYFFQIFILSLYVLFFLYALRGIYFHAKVKKWDIFKNPSALTLIFDSISLVFLFMSLLDPWGARGLSNSVFVFVVSLLAMPTVLLGILTLAFYFNDVLIARKLLSSRLGYMRIPFVIVMMVVMGSFLAFAIVFSLNYLMRNLVIFATALNMTFVSSSNIYLLICGLKLIKHTKKFNNNLENKSNFEKKLYPLLIFVTFGISVYFIGLSMFLHGHASGKFNGKMFEATWMMFWISSLIIIGSQVILFGVPFEKEKTSEMKGLIQKK